MPRVIKDGVEAAAGIAMGSNVARMHGKKDNYIQTDEQGVTISGPMSFVAGLGQIRTGALWTFNNELILAIPSTLATPSPTVIFNPPVKQLKNLIEGASIMISLLGGVA